MSMMVGARSTHSCEINVTPLIDVLLVLLIIFMVVLPEHKWGEKTLIPQPGAESVEKNPPAPIVIQLKDVGESKRPALKLNEEEISWDGLEARLTAAFRFRVNRVAFVKGDPEVDFEYVAEAVDITHHAGADRIGLMGGKRLALSRIAGKNSWIWRDRELAVNKRLANDSQFQKGMVSRPCARCFLCALGVLLSSGSWFRLRPEGGLSGLEVPNSWRTYQWADCPLLFWPLRGKPLEIFHMYKFSSAWCS